MTRAEQQQQTRQRLLDATLGVVRRRGLSEATIEEITELAGYSRGAFYAHFDSKEHAVLDVLEHNADERLEAFRQAVLTARSEKAAIGVITGLLLPAKDSTHPQVLRFGELTGLVSRDDDLRQRSLDLVRRGELVVGECIEHLRERRGLMPSRPRAELGTIVIALLHGLATRAHLDPELDVAALCRSSLELVLSS
jgi:AcrR family transcriptional regulator